MGFDGDGGNWAHLLSLSSEQQFGAAAFPRWPRTDGERTDMQVALSPMQSHPALARDPKETHGQAGGCLVPTAHPWEPCQAPSLLRGSGSAHFADTIKEGSCSAFAEAASYC